jgi:predicted amidohydrolase YtcJ
MRTLLVADTVRTPDAALGDAVLVEDERIVAVGRSSDLQTEGLATRRFPGATVVPGLRDAHLHPVGHAASLQRPILKNAPDFAALCDIVADAVRDQPAGTAVIGLRLDDETLAENRLPDRTLLDAVSTDHPILLIRYCGHVAVANSAALAMAGIDASISDPAGGSIDRDDRGDPTGVLRETAFEPVVGALKTRTAPLTPDHLVHGLTALASTGLTGIGAMVATDGGLWGGASSELEVLLEAAPRSPMDIRVFVIAATPKSLRTAADRIGDAGPMVSFAGVKMFSDGSFGGHTAAMHEPFADRPGELGTDRLDPSWAEELARTSLDLGGRVAIHAIGDRANGGVLDLMERLIDDGADPALMRVEHASVLTSADIDRFGRLGITASVQPAFIASETTWLEKRMGPERLQRTYPFRSLLDAGAPLAGGSDCPVEPPHPLLGMAAARDRLGVVPAEALTGGEALSLFTGDASLACGMKSGFDPGAPADLTVLGVDPVEVDADALRTASIVSTWVRGNEVEIPDGITAWQG